MSHLLVPGHPLLCESLAICRDQTTPTPRFRAAVSDIARFLAYEATRDWLPTLDDEVETPLGVKARARRLDSAAAVEIVPILRAGLAMVDGVLSLLPEAKILHVGYRRDEDTAHAVCYLTRLPERINPQTRFLILEPMLATGGTLIQVLEQMTERGAEPAHIAVLSLLSSRPALERIGARFPDVLICCAGVDSHLDERFFIVPGLGDAGDRAFGTQD